MRPRQQEVFRSAVEAERALGFPLAVPRWRPAGLTLRLIQAATFGAAGHAGPGVVTMVFSDGRRSLTLYQGEIVPVLPEGQTHMVPRLPNPRIIPPHAQQGIVHVQGVPARWLRGTWVTPIPRPGGLATDPYARWVEEPLAIVWQKDGRAYRLESRDFDLSTLVQVAHSLRP